MVYFQQKSFLEAVLAKTSVIFRRFCNIPIFKMALMRLKWAQIKKSYLNDPPKLGGTLGGSFKFFSI